MNDGEVYLVDQSEKRTFHELPQKGNPLTVCGGPPCVKFWRSRLKYSSPAGVYSFTLSLTITFKRTSSGHERFCSRSEKNFTNAITQGVCDMHSMQFKA